MRASSENYRVILPSAADSEPLVDRRIGPAFSTRFPSIDRARGTLTQLLRIVGHLRRALARFKSATGRTRCGELGTHFLDLGGLLLELGCESLCLLSELGCESFYLFLLLSDHRSNFSTLPTLPSSMAGRCVGAGTLVLNAVESLNKSAS